MPNNLKSVARLRAESLEAREVPATVSGVVFYDADRDGDLGPAEPGRIPGATVVLAGTLTDGTVVPELTATTGADGSFAFAELVAGMYTLTGTLPTGHAFSPAGPFSPAERTVTVGADDVTDQNFGAVAGEVSGAVYYDRDRDGTRGTAEPGVGGVELRLTGTNAAGEVVDLQATTAADGSYTFAAQSLTAGTYTLTETQPTGYGSSEIPDNVRVIMLAAGEELGGQNFGETLGSISGTVYRDLTLNGVFDPTASPVSDTGIAGVTVRLIGPQGELTTVTDADGNYTFADLSTGNYSVVEVQPAAPAAGGTGFYDGVDNIGSLGGANPVKNTLTLTLDTYPATQLSRDATGYDFGEFAPGSLYGFVYLDADYDGKRDPGERGIAGVGITISGTAFDGTPLARPLTASDLPSGLLTARTTADGRWEFPLLPPGTYSVVEAQPVGFTDWLDANEDPNEPVPAVGNDAFADIRLAPYPDRGPLNFGEQVRRAVVPPVPPLTVTPPPPPPPPDVSLRNFLTTPGGEVVAAEELPRPDLPTAPNYGAVGAANRPVYLAVAEETGGLVRVFDFSTGTERFQFRPFGPTDRGVRVATGDVNADGVPDIVCATGPGGPTVLKVFDGNTGAKIAKFRPFGSGYAGGADVAVGDLNGDSRADVVVGGGAHNRIKVYNGATVAPTGTPAVLGKFNPFGTGFTAGYSGGVRVAVGDVNNDDVPDVVAATASGRPVVAAFSGKTITSAVPFQPFSPYYSAGPNRTGGRVGVLDVNGDGFADIVTGASDGPARGRITDGKTLPAGGNPTVLRNVSLAPATLANGVAAALVDLDADGTAELVLASNAGARPVVSIHDAATGNLLTSFYAFDPNFLGGVEVG